MNTAPSLLQTARALIARDLQLLYTVARPMPAKSARRA